MTKYNETNFNANVPNENRSNENRSNENRSNENRSNEINPNANVNAPNVSNFRAALATAQGGSNDQATKDAVAVLKAHLNDDGVTAAEKQTATDLINRLAA